MLDVKNNYKGKYRDTLCRMCKNQNETTEHVLQNCTTIHPDDTNKIQLKDIYEDNYLKLKTITEKIKKIMIEIHNVNV